MSLDSGSTSTIGAIVAPLATIVNPALGLAIGGAFSFLTADASADEQRELTARNIKIQKDVQRANELRDRRVQRQVQGRFLQNVARSGFTTRGSPIERFADLVANQELDIQTSRFQTELSVQDLQIRGEHRAQQTRAAGFASFATSLGKSGLTLLNRRDDFDLLEA